MLTSLVKLDLFGFKTLTLTLPNPNPKKKREQRGTYTASRLVSQHRNGIVAYSQIKQETPCIAEATSSTPYLLGERNPANTQSRRERKANLFISLCGIRTYALNMTRLAYLAKIVKP